MEKNIIIKRKQIKIEIILKIYMNIKIKTNKYIYT